MSNTLLRLCYLFLINGFIFCQTAIVITDPRSAVPIGVPFFCENGLAEREVSEVVERNLQISGYFSVKPRDSYVQRQTRCQDPRLVIASDWSVLGVQYVVTATLTSSGSSVSGDFFLIDINKGVVLGKNYSGSAELKRAFAHRFSNEILKFFTGESGPFGSQIIYSSKVGRFKELALMDMDGYNQRLLTNTKGLANGPRFDSTGRRAVYTDFRKAIPDVFIIDIITKGITQVTSNRDQEISASFGPSDDQIFLTVANPRGGSSIVLVNRSGQVLRTVVGSVGEINVSPVYDPNSGFLYYVSDQPTGRPQVYRMPLSGGLPQRVSNVPSNYCTSPALTPKGDRLAFVCRFEGGFNIFVSNPDGSNAQQITSFGRNEDPSWSPDGRYLAFSSSAARGVNTISIIRFDGRAFTPVSRPFGGGDYGPDWGPVLY